MLWKYKPISFGMGFWTRSLGVGCKMRCYFSPHNELGQLCCSNQNTLQIKHGGSMCGDFYFNKENPMNSSTPLVQQ